MKMKNIDNGINVFQKIIDRPKDKEDPNSELVWDGYHWVKKLKDQESKSFDILKPGKTVQISNIPLQLNILPKDFKEFILDKMQEKNVMSSEERKKFGERVIRGLELDETRNSALMTMFNQDLAKRMFLLEGITLLGCTLRFSPYMETKYEENTHKGNLALSNSADLSAKSAAVAYAALNSFANNKSSKDNDEETNKEDSNSNSNRNTQNEQALATVKNNEVALFGKFKNVSLNSSLKVQLVPEVIIKVMNIVGENVLTMSTSEYNEMKREVKSELEKYGHVVSMFVVSKRSYCKIGAELGAIFVEFDDVKLAEMAYYALQVKKYDKKDFKVAFVNKKIFIDEILPESKKPQE
eukprot:CAMPEP_0170522880 /NCGR_PEP_ID=MMETSP0209-20121228/8282_1 /TAXON_ID=665100 ORGANISM="Litonotus pictus, Strain P1" /NCGR_SAMPLE_ID=MMETSP0209 /ASSEMBLY_ACC=CAM_ASM_000301 /LENGTH=352 /DNA_ID=CAMNT_0010810603 /DNA_START=653 /DNA_END=1711 /DNA_ORIENTATION=+